MICRLLKRRRRVTACRGGCNGNALSTCSCTRISLRRRMILTKTGRQHGKPTGSRSKFQRLKKQLIHQSNSNIMNLFFIHHPTNNPEGEAGKHTPVPIQNHEQNTNEGSEFLDDAIRMEDLPESYTEENITD